MTLADISAAAVEAERPAVILVVDDEDDVPSLFTQLFRRDVRAGRYELHFACTGVEALDVLANGSQFDLIITDINMPDMNGLELLDEVVDAYPELRSVVLSAYGDMRNIRKAMNRGAFDFVTKPVDFDDLRHTIERTLNHVRQWRDATASRDELVSLRRELDIAAHMQQSILPITFPQSETYSVHARMEPARSVGGDFYDVMRLEDDKIGLVVADVAGKGVPAAMLMMSARTLLKGAAIGICDPGLVLAEVNDLLTESNELRMFVTAFYGVYDPSSGELLYANAGHDPALVLTPAGDVWPLPSSGGIALGLRSGLAYTTATCLVEPGSSVFMYTDGVVEAFDAYDRPFGLDRLREVLGALARRPASELTAGVAAALRRFSGARAQADDVTCLALSRAGAGS